jgi:hypothetical protein
MKNRKKAPVSRSHTRGEGEGQTSISLSKEALKIGRQMARDDDRSFSNFVERLILAEAARQKD